MHRPTFVLQSSRDSLGSSNMRLGSIHYPLASPPRPTPSPGKDPFSFPQSMPYRVVSLIST